MQFISNILTRIPQPAWVGISISGVIMTFGLTISTIMSNDVELEVANSKLVLSRQIAKAKEQTNTRIRANNSKGSRTRNGRKTTGN